MKSFVRGLFYRFPENIARVFWGWNLLVYPIAAALTFISVRSGLDWKYFLYFRESGLFLPLFSAAVIGGIFPILAPLLVYFIGNIHKNIRFINTAFAMGQAALNGWLISSFIKAFTGRPHPPRILDFVDTSHEFHFGFLREGIFFGWPSSHTAVAFAVASALIVLYPKNRAVKWVAGIYALYVGIGVSATIHWFSDFVAGAIIGTVIGIIIGKSFLERFRAVV